MFSEDPPARVGHRICTVTAHLRAVEQAIVSMSERLDEDLSLEDLARVAIMSPYHFNRVFHEVTGIPPSQFLYALRLEMAKRLLLTTQFNVTDVCYEVGYNSLGTFTRRFTRLVGVPPGQLRRLASLLDRCYLETLLDRCSGSPCNDAAPGPGISGRIKIYKDFYDIIFVGLYPTRIPQGRPIGCALLTAQGSYRIAPVPEGRYHVIAAALSWSDDLDPMKYLLLHDAPRGEIGPLSIAGDRVTDCGDLVLRPARLTDPPILVALSLLLNKRQ